ncbi:MAG: DinB family protein [Ginsengibacter sp.]
MSKNKKNTQDLFDALENATTELIDLISAADSVKINSIPFRNSWTAAQLAAHVTKSNNAIIQAMGMEGEKAKRNSGERIRELKSIFLNYETRFQSPDFIMPTQQIYEKKIIVTDLKKSIERFKTIARKTDLTEIIGLPSFGEITKLELAWFVLYHTQRHIYQLTKILASLANNKNFTEDNSKRPVDKSTNF